MSQVLKYRLSMVQKAFGLLLTVESETGVDRADRIVEFTHEVVTQTPIEPLDMSDLPNLDGDAARY
jgi:hypothetical protein